MSYRSRPGVCEQCGEAYMKIKPSQRFCTKRCAGLATSRAGERQRERFEADLASTPTRRVGDRVVYLPEDEPPFVLAQRVGGGNRRRRGELRVCEKCDKEYFWPAGARQNQAFCSHACAGEKVRKTKQAKSLARGGPKKDTLDRWFSLVVRAVGYCQRCGTTERLQCAHILSRRYMGVRFAFDNAMCLCARCHMYFTHRPLEWEEYVVEHMGEPAFRALKRRALDYRGPLDRKKIAEDLYALAIEHDVRIKDGQTTGHHGWTGLRDEKDAV